MKKDNGLHEMKFEQKKSKLPIVCGVLCVSMIGGYIYYVQDLAKSQYVETPYVEIEEDDDIDWSELTISSREHKKFSDYQIVEEVKDLASNVAKGTKILIDNTTEKISELTSGTGEYDKWGNPYKKVGASYTFREDGYPVEASRKDGEQVVNPSNGDTYEYYAITGWANRTEAIKTIKKNEMEAAGLIDHQGNTDVHKMSDEMASYLAKNSVLNVASAY